MLAHRKRRPTPSQGLENRALRVVQARAMAASRGLDDASSIAGTPAPNPPPCLDDAGHDYFSDRLLAGPERASGGPDQAELKPFGQVTVSNLGHAAARPRVPLMLFCHRHPVDHQVKLPVTDQ